jgi:glycosyl transferase family 25
MYNRSGNINSIEDIKHAFYINLEHRLDRKQHVEDELNKIGIKAERFNAIKMENGAIGCSMSHLKLLQEAQKNNLDHILIVEDDIKFLNVDLFKAQFNKFLEKHGNNWDVILLAGNNMPPYEKIDDTCIKVSRCQTTTGYIVNGHYIKVLAQNVKMGLTHLLQKPNEANKFAIDKFWFVLQNNSKWYLITPPTVIQREDYSDIEKKITNYEKIMIDLDKAEMFKAIKQMRENEFIKQNKKYIETSRGMRLMNFN